jgi:hypothetical protein
MASSASSVREKGRFQKIYGGNETDYRVALGDKEVRATAYTAADGFSEGSKVWMTFKKTLIMNR